MENLKILRIASAATRGARNQREDFARSATAARGGAALNLVSKTMEHLKIMEIASAATRGARNQREDFAHSATAARDSAPKWRRAQRVWDISKIQILVLAVLQRAPQKPDCFAQR